MRKKYPFIISVAQSLPGAEIVYKEAWQCDIFLIQGKMFALFGKNNNDQDILTLKGDPLENANLREIFPEIVPGYYANKAHWNSILLEKTLSKEMIESMLKKSYQLVISKLPKKKQAEILQIKY